VLAVCGLAAEARLVAGTGVRTVAGGGRAGALAVAIEREIEAGVDAIVSIGVAGALVPHLKPGALLVADRVVAAGETFEVDAVWAAAMLARIPTAISATLAGSETIVADPFAKARLHDASGASAVDMESQVAARIAKARGLPFAALRAIADPLKRTLPPAATVAMRADGTIDLPAVLWAIATRPSQLPELLRIGSDTRRALRSLGRGCRLLGGGLGYPDLDELSLDVV